MKWSTKAVRAPRIALCFRYLPLVALVCLGVLSSILAFTSVRTRERDREEADLKYATDESVFAIRDRIGEYPRALERIAGLCAGSREVGRADFRSLVQPYLASTSGVRGLAWVACVPDSERAAYEAAGSDGVANRQLTQRAGQGWVTLAARRTVCYPICCIEPQRGNEVVLGYDLGSARGPRQAIERARDTGRMTATAPLALPQEPGKSDGFLVLKPLYRSGAPTDTVAQRRANLLGLVVAIFRAGDVVEAALAPLAPRGVDLQLYDTSDPHSPRFLWLHSSRTRTEAASPLPYLEARRLSSLHRGAVLDVAGRQWWLLSTPTPGFVAERESYRPWAALAGGLAVTGLLAVYVLLILVRSTSARRCAVEMLAANEEIEKEIAERRRAEEAQQETSARREELERIIARSPAVAFLWRNAEGWPVEYVSDSIRLFGHAPDDLISGRVRYADIVHPDDLARVASEVAQHSREPNKHEFAQVYRLLTASGDVRWIEDRTWIRRGETGAITHYQGIICDITARREAQEALEREMAKLAAMISAMDEGVVFADADGYIIEVNRSFAQLMGKRRSEILGEPISRFHSSEVADRVQRLLDRFRSEVDSPAVTFERGVGGAELMFRIQPIYRAGRYDGVLVNVVDVTELVEARREAEAMNIRLRAMNQESEARQRELEAQTQQLIAANTELAEAYNRIARQRHEVLRASKLASLGTMAAGVAHEINNPLVAVAGYSEMLLDKLEREAVCEPPDLADYFRTRLKIINEEAFRCKAIMQGLLGFSLRPEVTPSGMFDLRDVIARSMTLLGAHERHSPESSARVDLGPAPIPVRGDRDGLTHVFLNIGMNAFDAMEPGDRLYVTAHLDDGSTVVVFRDEGRGMASETLAAILDPFFTTKELGEGAGLGLAVAQGIIEANGGTIDIESEPGVGTTVTVRLPLAQEQVADGLA
jgi:PAS domain S-box-containing protein